MVFMEMKTILFIGTDMFWCAFSAALNYRQKHVLITLFYWESSESCCIHEPEYQGGRTNALVIVTVALRGVCV